VKDFGATVRLTRTQEALLHLSEISHNSSLTKRPVHELLTAGQKVRVMVRELTVEIRVCKSVQRRCVHYLDVYARSLFGMPLLVT
jgi:predicted RNA-binding protein with RPS1 domain